MAHPGKLFPSLMISVVTQGEVIQVCSACTEGEAAMIPL